MPPPKRTEGFTLIELVIVTIILGIMAAALVPLVVSSLGAYYTTLGDIVVLDKQRYAIERLAREIREVSYDQASSSFTFGSMGDHDMSFTRQFVFDASGTAASATVSIGTTANEVTLGYGGTPQVLTDQLKGTTGLAFSYFNQSGVAFSPANTTDVRAIDIGLTLTHNGNDYTQTTRVELKNFSKQ